MDPLFRIFSLIVIIPSAIIHEVAHGWVADKLGDPTARYAGRLTLDPRVHIDLWGTIILPLVLYFSTGFIFAYAKPVPYNPYNLRNARWGSALVGAAGPGSNLLLALAFSAVMWVVQSVGTPSDSLLFFLQLIYMIVYINVLLAVFNLMPVPPLDGSKVLFALLPDKYDHLKANLERYWPLFMILFLFVLWPLLSPIIDFITILFASGFGFFGPF